MRLSYAIRKILLNCFMLKHNDIVYPEIPRNFQFASSFVTKLLV